MRQKRYGYRRHILLSLFCLGLLAGCCEPNLRGEQPFSLLEKAAGAVVSIHSATGAVGSGFLIEDGLVVTNTHLVDSDLITVVLSDGRQFPWQGLREDTIRDLAVGRIAGKNLPSLQLSKQPLRLGEPVYALGNPFGLGLTVTHGIVSALPRAINKAHLLQIDAAINPGNSGGPLIDNRGKVVAVVSARSTVGSGIGFAVPVEEIGRLLPAGD